MPENELKNLVTTAAESCETASEDFDISPENILDISQEFLEQLVKLLPASSLVSVLEDIINAMKV